MAAPFPIALAQTGFQPNALTSALARLEQLCAEARAGGARLLMVPETFLCGYGDAALTRALAFAPDDARGAALCAVARRQGIALVAGYAERAADGLYNSALLVSAEGEILLNSRKMHPWGPFERSCFRPGGRGGVATLAPGLEVGLLICYDIEHGAAVEDLARRGAGLILAISATTAGFEVVPRAVVPTRAYEAGVFVAFCNHVGSMNGSDFIGLSTVAAPDGTILAAAPADAEAMLFAEIDPAALPARAAGGLHRDDRRPDLFPHP